MFQSVINDQSDKDERFEFVSYRQVNSATFESDLLKAIAEGRSPNLIILSSDDLVRYRSILVAVSLEQFPPRAFQDIYIEGTGIFAFSNGVYAQPFAVDPMVMYWNRDLFSRAGLALPPTNWETLKTHTVPTLTERLDNLDIVRSAVALGEYQNIRHAKSTLLLLALQLGSPLVTENRNIYEVSLNTCLLYTSPSPRDRTRSRMPSSA